MIRLSQVRKNYKQVRVLQDAELEINTGRLILITGTNGAGKTTLLRITAGLEKPDHARISIADENLDWSRAAHYLRENIVYLHQKPYLFHGTVRDNLLYAIKVSGTARKDRLQRLEDTVTHTTLEPLLDRDSKYISGGEAQRVALTRAVLTSRPVLLLDEPTTHMDESIKAELLEQLLSIRQQGRSAVVVSHDLNSQWLAAADEQLILANGCLSATQS